MRQLKRRATWFWATYLSVGVGYELHAVGSDVQGDTLSEQVWFVLENTPAFVAGMVLVFLIWLAVHFLRPALRKGLRW